MTLPKLTRHSRRSSLMKSSPVAAPESEGELVLPVPADAPPMPETHFALGRPIGAVDAIATLPARCCSRCCGSTSPTATRNFCR